MRLSIIVPRGAENWYFTILPRGRAFQKIVVDGVVVFNIFKRHDHRYDLDAFFYASKRIVSGLSFTTKSKLHGAIQKLLQEELNVDVQLCSGDRMISAPLSMGSGYFLRF